MSCAFIPSFPCSFNFCLQNIVEMYPEGPQQLNELIQNADDAKATVVKFLASRKQYGKSSLLGQKMEEWQGQWFLNNFYLLKSFYFKIINVN